MLEKFQNVVHKERTSKRLVEGDLLAKRNLSSVRTASIVVLGVSIFWIAVSFISPNYQLDTTSFIAVILHFVASIYMFILSFKAKKTYSPLVRFSFLIYYAIILFGVFAIANSRNVRILAQAAEHSDGIKSLTNFIGVSTSAFYVLLIALIPLPYLLDTVLSLIFMAVALVLPDILNFVSVYGLFSNIILFGATIVTYIHFKRTITQSAHHEMTVNRLSFTLTDYSYCDSLTKVLNRRALDEYIDNAIYEGHAKTLGVIFFDIDFFKKYNDTYNHINGDKALIRVAEAASKTVNKEKDIFLFRYGGEEFIILIKDANEEMLIDAMKKLHQSIYDANLVRHDVMGMDRITVSIGGSIESLPNETGDYIINADNQLYNGKHNRRNSISFQDRFID